MTAFGSTWGENSQMDCEAFIEGEMHIFGQSSKIFDMIAKQNSLGVQLSVVFTEQRCSLCISQLNSQYFIRISSPTSVKRHNLAADSGESLLAGCFEVNQFRNMFSVLKAGKTVEFTAVKAASEGGVIMHFRQVAQANPLECITFVIHGIQDLRREGKSTGQLNIFDNSMKLGAISGLHGCTISFQNAFKLSHVISHGVALGFQYVGFLLKSVIGNRLELAFYRQLAECLGEPSNTATMEGGADNFKAESHDKDFVASAKCVVSLKTFSIIAKCMEKDMSMTMAFHKNNYIYMSGKHIIDDFEVVLATVDLKSLDSNDIEAGSVAMEDDRFDSDDGSGSEMKSDRNKSWRKHED